MYELLVSLAITFPLREFPSKSFLDISQIDSQPPTSSQPQFRGITNAFFVFSNTAISMGVSAHFKNDFSSNRKKSKSFYFFALSLLPSFAYL